MEKDREVRYQSAKDLLVDLRRLKRDRDSAQVVAATDTAPIQKSRRSWQRREPVLIAGVVDFRCFGNCQSGAEDAMIQKREI